MGTFKNGDKVVVNVDNPCCAPIQAGDIVVVVNSEGNEYEVETANGVTWWVNEDHIDVYIDLPKGTQLNLGPLLVSPAECDCGGYATFKSMAPQYHSHTLPCSSLRNKI